VVDWHGIARISAAGERDISWRLPRRDLTAIGRAASSGIKLTSGWIPNQLAVLRPESFGWLLENGRSTRVTVGGPGVRDARFGPGGVIALVRGQWTLDWALDKPLTAEIAVRSTPPPGNDDLPWALSRKVQPDTQRQLTDYVAEPGLFSPAERHLLAVMFGYELNGDAPPRNLCEAAAGQLGLTASQVKNRANTVRRRINKKRQADIDTFEELGFYLVHTSRALSPDDQEP